MIYPGMLEAEEAAATDSIITRRVHTLLVFAERWRAARQKVRE